MTEEKPRAPKALYYIVAAIIVLATLSQIVILKYGNFKKNSQNIDDGIDATILYDPAPITSFRLIDHKGNDFTQNNFSDQWSFITFGYTHCPDICPTTLNTLNHVDKILKESNSPVIPQYVFVSLDPERDDVNTLANFIPWFNKDFIGLTGSTEQIEVITRMLGVINQRRPSGSDSEDYLIDHTVVIMMIDTQGQLRALSSAPHEATTIASDFKKITQKFN